MSLPPAPFVPASSSADNVISISRAKRSKAACHFHGMKPRTAHMDTAGWFNLSNRLLSKVGPPKRKIISRALVIRPNAITFNYIVQAIKCSNAQKPGISQNVIMSGDQPSDREMRAVVAVRVEWLLDLALENGETKTAFAKRMGITYPNLKARLKNRSFSIHSLMRLADSLSTTLDFICGRDNIVPDVTERPKTLMEMLPTTEKPAASETPVQLRKAN